MRNEKLGAYIDNLHRGVFVIRNDCSVQWCSVVFSGVQWCSVVFSGVQWCILYSSHHIHITSFVNNITSTVIIYTSLRSLIIYTSLRS